MSRSRSVVSSNQRFIDEFSQNISLHDDRSAMVMMTFIDSALLFEANGRPKQFCLDLAKIVKKAKPHLALEVDAFVEQSSVTC